MNSSDRTHAPAAIRSPPYSPRECGANAVPLLGQHRQVPGVERLSAVDVTARGRAMPGNDESTVSSLP
jgi:hypothetical protein